MNAYENYYKDKIDWNFYNYLHDRFIDFEDLGNYKLRINILISNINNLPSKQLWIYSDKEPSDEPTFNKYNNLYTPNSNECIWMYSAIVYDIDKYEILKFGESFFAHLILKEYIKKIQNKIDIIRDEHIEVIFKKK